MGRKEENELKLRVSSLRQKVDELEAARASLQRKLDAKGDEIATLNDLNAALRADNVSAQERYAALEATLSAAQRDAALENERSGAFASPARGGGGGVVRARSDSERALSTISRVREDQRLVGFASGLSCSRMLNSTRRLSARLRFEVFGKIGLPEP